MKKEKIQKGNKKIRLIIIIILAVLLISAIVYLTIYFYNANKNKELYDDISSDNSENVQISDEMPPVTNNLIEDIKQLQTENTDVKGWIKIDDTNINYPLLQSTDNSYYLTHTYKKEKSSYGSIFINSNSNIKDVNSNVIIYGHDMKNTQMFGELLKYKDKAFYEQHPTIKITTEESEETYEIVYVFKSRVFYKDEKNVFRYYQQYNFKDEKSYNQYINNCKKIQLYDTGKTANYGEQLITLITCEYSQENGRMVVVAKKIQ